MPLPIKMPPSPMLAKAVAEVPAQGSVEGGWTYEPKWDGFRCLVWREDDTLTLLSRSGKPLDRYFPEVVEMLRAVLPRQCVLDGELVVRSGRPGAWRLDWELLSARVHPAASRVERLSVETPAELVCFDLLALGDEDLQPLPQQERRARLEELFAALEERPPRLHLSRCTDDEQLARDWFERFEGAGLDGVVAKRRLGAYEQGRRTMLKVKHRRTAEAVVVGYRVHRSGSGVGSLLLGLYDEDGELVPVGGIGAFTTARRQELVEKLDPLVLRDEQGRALTGEGNASRFASARDSSFVPLEPTGVVEVAFDQLEGRRFRHAVTLLRWRPDREASSCLLEQVERPIAHDLDEVLVDAHLPR